MTIKNFKVPYFLMLLTLMGGAASCNAQTKSPDRAKGIQGYLYPKKIANSVDPSDESWGLSLAFAPYLKHEGKKPVIHSIQDFSAFVEKQDASVKANGVWIAKQKDSIYSPAELQFWKDIQAYCHRQGIPLFVTAAGDYPNKFQQVK